MIYSEKVMDHYANPRNVGEIEDANGVGEVGNAKCGDIMKMYLKIEDNTIKDGNRHKLHRYRDDKRQALIRSTEADQ